MEPQTGDIYIGDRLSSFQAAAACISITPLLRSAGQICIFAGVAAVVVAFLSHVPITSPFFWIFLALFGFGIYLHLPEPQPVALPAAGIVILTLLADAAYVDYQQWHRYHHAFGGDGIGLIVEALLAASLFVSYVTYKRNLSATDPDTLSKLRALAIAVNKSDLDQDTGIAEFDQKNNRLRIRKLDRFILLVVRHYIAFGLYSKLDEVVIQTPEAVIIEAVGTSKPSKPLKLRFSCQPIKTIEVKLEPQYLPRISDLGITIKGLPMAKQPRL